MGGSNTLFRRIPSYDFVYCFLSAAVIDKLLYLVARHHVVDDSGAVCRVVVQLELEAELNHIVNGLFRNVQFYEIVPVESDFDLPEVYSRYGKNTQAEEDSDLVTVESCTSERPSEEYCVINIRYKEIGRAHV